MIMSARTYRQGTEQILRRLSAVVKTRSGGNTIVGVAGYVASGKSRLCHTLRSDIEVITRQPLVYLPFDLWVNHATVHVAPDYAGRFMLDDFVEALRCMSVGERFLVPRYDIVKTSGPQKVQEQTSVQQLLWNRKGFIKTLHDAKMPTISGATDLYVDMQSGMPYSLFPASGNTTFMVDGTLIFPAPVAGLYDCDVFVQASWPLRVSRMIRRFNRKEVFGTTTRSMRDYVGFLVDEARSCADREIKQQITDKTLILESVPDTLSNYFDLAYLRWYIQQPDVPQWVARDEVEEAMSAHLQNIRDEHDPRKVEMYRQELVAITESKHLFSLEDTDRLIGELAAAIT